MFSVSLRITAYFTIIIVTSLFLISCQNWDVNWHLSKQWSAELTVLQKYESILKVKRLGILISNRRNTFTTLQDYNNQHPLYIDNVDTIMVIFSEISGNEYINSKCSAADQSKNYYHLVALDENNNAAYIIICLCANDAYASVWNYDDAGIYWSN